MPMTPLEEVESLDELGSLHVDLVAKGLLNE